MKKFPLHVLPTTIAAMIFLLLFVSMLSKEQGTKLATFVLLLSIFPFSFILDGLIMIKKKEIDIYPSIFRSIESETFGKVAIGLGLFGIVATLLAFILILIFLPDVRI
jgi:hypothetical protein